MDGYFKERKESVALNLAQEMMEKNIGFDVVAYNVLMNGLLRLGKLGMTMKATLVLKEMTGGGFLADIDTYNAFICGYCRSSHMKRAFATYSQMLAEGVSPNIETYNLLLGGLSSAGLMTDAEELFGQMKNRGFVPNASTYDTLVSGHGKKGNKKEAIRLYCEMVSKGFVPKTSTYNILISDFAKAGKMGQARELMNEMQTRGTSPNSSTYNILICSWCWLSKQPELERSLKKSYRAEAKRLLTDMKDKDYVPCEITLLCISSTFARPGKKADAQRLLKELYKKKSYDQEMMGVK
ncbi:hypothetical protein EV1_006829 [Malus domestica]